MSTTERVGCFLAEFTEWVRKHDDVVAAALVGSYANGTATPQSDVDVVILSEHPGTFVGDQEWPSRFGTVVHRGIERYGRLTSLRIQYDDGLEVEYGLTDERWAELPLDEGTRGVIANGIKVLFERENVLSRHLPMA